jgi:predicted alpha/beta-hydrolase family hydrolase
MVAATQPSLVDRLLLLSYPLHPPKKPSEMRTGHFGDIRTPAFFVHGVRDGFGSIAEMESAIKLIPAQTKLTAIPSAGHELMSDRNRNVVVEQVVQPFLAF